MILNYQKDYYKKNRKRILRNKKIYHLKNREKRCFDAKIYRKNNPDKIKKLNHDYYQCNQIRMKKEQRKRNQKLRKLGIYSLLQKKWTLAKRYGISLEEYENILNLQIGRNYKL